MAKKGKDKKSKNVLKATAGLVADSELHSSISPHVILDWLPSTTALAPSDTYYIPPEVHHIKVSIAWGIVGRDIGIEVENYVCIIGSSSEKDKSTSGGATQVVNISGKVTRCGAIISLPPTTPGGELPVDERFEKLNAFTVDLDTLDPQISAFITCIAVKTESRTLADVRGPQLIVSDTHYYPGETVLATYEQGLDDSRICRSLATLLFLEDRYPLKRGAHASKKSGTRGAEGAGCTSARLWQIFALGVPVPQSTTLQDLQKHLVEIANSTVPPTRAIVFTGCAGGDPMRVAVHHFIDRVRQLAEQAAQRPGGESDAEKIDAILEEEEAMSERQGRLWVVPPGKLIEQSFDIIADSASNRNFERPDWGGVNITKTGAENSNSLQLVYVEEDKRISTTLPQIDAPFRVRVIRKGPGSYSVGRGDSFEEFNRIKLTTGDYPTKCPLNDSLRYLCAEKGRGLLHALQLIEPTELRLITELLPFFSDPTTARYTAGTYNVGSTTGALISHIYRYIEEYTAALLHAASSAREALNVGITTSAPVPQCAIVEGGLSKNQNSEQPATFSSGLKSLPPELLERQIVKTNAAVVAREATRVIVHSDYTAAKIRALGVPGKKKGRKKK